MQEMKPNTPQSAPLDAGHEQASRLSAFMDGEVGVSECQALVRGGTLSRHAPVEAAQTTDTVLATWSEYHVISRVLQGQPAMASTSTQAFLQRWRTQVGDSVPEVNVPAHRDQAGQVLSAWNGVSRGKSANDSRWQWFAAAAITGLAVTMIWRLQPSSTHSGQVVAAVANVASTPVPVQVQDQKQEDMALIRNPALDELLLAHRRQGGASALQVPAGFMRGVSAFNSP